MNVVPKLWGCEKIIRNDLDAGYCLKELTVEPDGYACSIHYHVKKTETFYVIAGRIFLELFSTLGENVVDASGLKDRRIFQLHVGDNITLQPFTPHRFWALGYEGIFIEGSSPDDPADSYRIVQAGPVPTDYDPATVPQYPSL